MKEKRSSLQLLPIHENLSNIFLWISAIALIYFIFARISLLLAFKPEGIAAIWPPSGIFLASLLLTRRNLRSWLIGALFTVDFISEMLSGTPWHMSLIYAGLLSGDALLSAWLLWRFTGEGIDLSCLRELFGWLVISVIFSNALTGLIAAGLSSSFFSDTSIVTSWVEWVTSNALGNLIFTPLILGWFSWWKTHRIKRFAKRILEGVVLYVLLVGFSYSAFFFLDHHAYFSVFLIYMLFPFMVWAAFRFGVKGAATACLIVSVEAVLFAYNNRINFIQIQNNPLAGILIIQFYLIIVTVTTLILATATTEWHVIKERLSSIEQPYEAIVANTPDHILIQDDMLRYTLVVNPQLGLREEDMIGKTDFEILNREDAKNLTHQKMKVLASGKPMTVETSLITLAGDREFFAGIYMPRMDETGHTIGLIGYFHNITDQRIAESQQKSLYDILNASLNELYIFDAETLHFEFVSEGALRNLGYSMEEMRGMTPVDIKPEFSRASFEQYISPLRLHNLSTLNFETNHRRVDGSEYPVEVHLQLFDQPNHPVFLAVILDITDRKQTEQALVESETRFKMLFDQAPLGYQSLDIDGKFIEVNQAWLDILGYSKEEVIGHWFGEFLSPDYVEPFKKRFPVFKAAGQIHSEFEMVRKDGTHRFISFEGRIGKDPGGKFKQTHCILEDISERKRVEEALKQNERRLAEAQEIANIGSWEYEYSTDKMQWSKKMFEIFGRDPSLGDPSWSDHRQSIHPDDWEKLDQAVAAKIPYNIEFRLLHPTLGVRWAHTISQTETDISGRVVKLKGTVQDISERKQAEELLRESESRFRAIFEQAAVGVAQLDTKTGQYLRINQKYCDLIGYSRDEMLSKTFMDITYPEDTKMNVELNSQLVSGEVENFSIEKRFVRNDGSIMWALLTASPMWKPGEQPDHYTHIAIIEDITSRREAELKLQQSEESIRAIVDASPFPIAIVDIEDDKIDFWSKSALTKFGHTAPTTAEWYQIAYPDPIYRKEVINRWKPALEKARLSGESVNTGEYRVSCKDGSIKICELFATFIMDKLIVTFSDITERKNAEQALSKSEDKFRNFFGNAIIGMSLTDPKGPMQVNQAFCDLLGYSLEELRALTWQQITHPEDIEKTQRVVDQLKSKEIESVRIEKRYLKKDGSIVWVDLSTRARWDEQGDLLYMMTTLFDITERKNIELVLRENEQRFRSIFEGVKDAILVQSVSEQILDVNHAACEMYGYTYQEFLTKSVKDLVISEESIIHYDPKHPEKLPEGTVEEINLRANGEQFPLEMSIKPQKWLGNDVILVVGRDISERKRVEAEVHKRDEDLSLLNEINVAANRHEDMAAIANLVSDRTKLIFNCLGATLSLVDRERAYLVMQNFDVPRELAQNIEKLIGVRIPQIKHDLKADHPYRRVFESGKPMLINDLEGVQEFTKGYIYSQDWTEKTKERVAKLIPTIVKLIGRRSLIVMPLISEGEIIGTLEVAGKDPYSEDDLLRLEQITRQLTTVITRLQTETRITEKMDELRRWYEATLGRETRILDLKREVNELMQKTGQSPKYNIGAESTTNE